MPQCPPKNIKRISLDSQSQNSWIYTYPSSFNFASIKQAEIYSTALPSATSNNQLSIPPGPYFDKPNNLTHTLKTTSTLETATDGSLCQGSMTASWALKLNSKFFKTGGKIPKGSSHPSSTRAERGVYLHLLINIYKLATHSSLSNKEIKTYIYNKQVIDYSNLSTQGSGPTGFMVEDYDLLDGIRYHTELLQNKYHITFQQKHIYSHLDDSQKRRKIEQKHGESHLNLHLHNKTTRTLNQICNLEVETHHQDSSYLQTPKTPKQINVLFQGQLHTSKNLHYLHAILQEQQYKSYLQEKFNWSDQTLKLIDWEAIEYYIKTLTIQKKVKYIKLSHKWRPTHHKLFQTSNGETQSPGCSLCGADKKNDNHPFSCTNPTMQDAHKESLKNLKKTLKTIGTYPLMTEVIIHYLKNWMKHTQPDYTHRLLQSIPIHHSLLQNIQDQTSIGWDNLLRGKIATSWTTTQKLYTPGKNMKLLKKKLIINLIHMSNYIWESRNKMNFGTTETKLSKQQKQLEPLITKLYTHYKKTTQHSHHHLFNTRLQLRIKFSPQENSQWICTVKIAMRLHKKKQKHFFKTHKKNTQYFNTRKRKTQEKDQEQQTNANQHRNKLRKTTQSNIGTFLIHRDPPNDAPT